MNGPYYVAAQIGCLECGEPSGILGIFLDRGAAERACVAGKTEHDRNWRRSYEVFEVAELTP